MNKTTMKKFTVAEIRDLYNRFFREEISFTRMVEMINDRVGEANEPQYKDGDFVVNVLGSVLIFKKKVGNFIYDHAYLANDLIIITIVSSHTPIERYATEAEKQKLLNALAKRGKRWNEEKKCVEDIPSYKKGDFLVKEYKNGNQYIFILDYIDDEGLIYYHCYYSNSGNLTYVEDDFGIGSIGDSYHKCLRYATDSEKELLITELSKVGKRWNEDKKCIEDIPKRKFKVGDKVRIKEGVSSKTHCDISPGFVEKMDKLIVRELIVENCSKSDFVKCDGYYFSEDWLELWSDEPKVGDWVIFWDNSPKVAKVGILTDIRSDSRCKYCIDGGVYWMHAVKWEGTKKHIKKVRKGEI